MMACHDGVNTLTYDAEGRLATSYSPIFGVTSSYFYDAGGQRVSKIFGSYETDYVHDPGGALLTTYVNGSYFGNFQDLWVDGRHFGEVVMAAGNASQTQNFSLTDWLGSQAAYTDSVTGVPNAAYVSQPFGDAQTTLFGSNNDDIHFTGKERDGETGNDYFGTRYYGSSMGRFLSPDPIWIKGDRILDPQRLNLYAYTMNNPLRFTDPSGMDVNLGNCPGSMTIKMCEGAIIYGLSKNDRGHVHFVEGNDKNGYKKGEVGVLVDADYESKSLNFTTLQSLANDHSALAKVDILDPNDSYSFRSEVNYPPTGLTTLSSKATDFAGYTFMQYRGKEEEGILYSTGDFTDVVVDADDPRGFDLTQSIFHELQHVFLGDFGRSAPKAQHGLPEVEDRTKAAEKEAEKNEKEQ